MPWFQLVAGGDPADPNDWIITSTPSCTGVGYICAIQTGANANNKPVITTPLRNEMIHALNTQMNTTNVHLRSIP